MNTIEPSKARPGAVAQPQLPRTWRNLNGVLLLDKPSGPSSNAVLQSAKRLFKARKAGHTGTLDPLATGLLPVCFGEATKFSTVGLEADKVYEATIAFGVTTTTGDSEGDTVERRAPVGLQAKLPQVVNALIGNLRQSPPMFSAARYQGKRLYEYARSGQTVERPARSIAVHEIKVLDVGDDYARLELRVSKGTYIRTLAEEIGEKVGCGAHLAVLRRTRVGDIGLQEAITLDALAAYPEDARPGVLRPLDFLASVFPIYELGDSAIRALRQGQSVASPGAGGWIGTVRVYQSGRFVGLADRQEGGLLVPRRLIVANV